MKKYIFLVFFTFQAFGMKVPYDQMGSEQWYNEIDNEFYKKYKSQKPWTYSFSRDDIRKIAQNRILDLQWRTNTTIIFSKILGGILLQGAALWYTYKTTHQSYYDRLCAMFSSKHNRSDRKIWVSGLLVVLGVGFFITGMRDWHYRERNHYLLERHQEIKQWLEQESGEQVQ